MRGPVFKVLSLTLLAGLTALRPGAAPAAESFRDCPTCPELVRIPAGSFLMGSTEAETTLAGMKPERARQEWPQHAVMIRHPFAIGRYEVTIAQFAEYSRETGFQPAKGCYGLLDRKFHLDPEATWERPGWPVSPRHPVVCVSPNEYLDYVAWLSKKTAHRYRLPSEAEWEYAARTGLRAMKVWRPDDPGACRLFNAGDAHFRAKYGDPWPTFACDDGFADTAPVGSFPPNRYGMYDVFGNASEVVADCFQPNHEGAPVDGSVRGGPPGCARVAKGGSPSAEPGFLRPALRVLVTPEVHGTGIGLRVLRELP
jgi:formylglycine-generating enzyme required for sulfatase activity